MLLPVSVAHKNDWGGPFLVVVGTEIPPDDRPNSEDLEKVG